jgi:hydroxymethylpyrimidine/phosphomethylpyrimidine kinase
VALITPNLPEAAALLDAPHARSEQDKSINILPISKSTNKLIYHSSISSLVNFQAKYTLLI